MNSNWHPSTFLGRLEEPACRDILRTGVPVLYRAGKPLLRQGDEGRHVVLLISGVVKVMTRAESGYEMLTAVRLTGDLVGEMAAVENQPRSGTVIACGVVSTRVISWELFEGLMSRHPQVIRALWCMVSARLRWANERRLDFGAYDAPTRLARILAELARSYGRPEAGSPVRRLLDVTLTQAELASLAGLKLKTAEKAIADLSEQGLLQRSYRRLTICDLPRLLRVAQMTLPNPS